MRIYIDRFNSQLQVILDRSYSDYETVELWISRGFYDSGIKADSRKPCANYVIPFRFSTNQAADIFLVGVRDGDRFVLAQKPLLGQANNTNITLNRQLWNLKRDKRRYLETCEEVIIYLRQQGERCSCWNVAYEQADPNCSVCGGTGLIVSYIGMRKKVSIPSEEAATFLKDADGEDVSKKLTGCWIDGFPFLSDKDVVERSTGERYYVITQKDIIFAQEMVEQTFDLVNAKDYINQILNEVRI